MDTLITYMENPNTSSYSNPNPNLSYFTGALTIKNQVLTSRSLYPFEDKVHTVLFLIEAVNTLIK